VSTVARLLLDKVEQRPDLRLGVSGDLVRLDEAMRTALAGAELLADAGLRPGSRIAVTAGTSTDQLVFWMACQLAGVEVAMVNPSYPDELLGEMFGQLRPDAVAASGPQDLGPHSRGDRPVWSYGGLRTGTLTRDGEALAVRTASGRDPVGLSLDPLAVAGYQHTSGTTGLPKFCAQSHTYFRALGRFIADVLCIGPDDKIYAPLPSFHINPFGYGFLGGLTGAADVVMATRFSATDFWPTVRDEGITVMFLHAPPVEILKKRTDPKGAEGHAVRAMFFTDVEFLDRYGIGVGLSGYGSTEAAGLCHTWTWRRGESPDVPEGTSRVGGTVRHDVEARVDADGQILVRGRAPGILFSGYRGADGLAAATDADGWFATGDLGRIDEEGRLVFLERMAESIRVKGEFVPIGHVEQVHARLVELHDVAVWKRPGPLDGDEVVLYAVCETVPAEALRAVAADLPAFMRPAAVARVSELPRDAAAGKVQRRRLGDLPVLEWVEL
jgi:crotonobetaine/carnitine-CoA ligase